MVTATSNLTFTFSDAGQAAKEVIAIRLAFGKGHISEPSATTLVSTARWLPFATKWRKPANPHPRQPASPCLARRRMTTGIEASTAADTLTANGLAANATGGRSENLL